MLFSAVFVGILGTGAVLTQALPQIDIQSLPRNHTSSLAGRDGGADGDVPEIKCDDEWSCKLANPDSLTVMLKYLRKKASRKGKPSNGAGKCGKVACYWKQGIEWCNESDEFMELPNYEPIMNATEKIRDKCRHTDISDPKFRKQYGNFCGYARYPNGLVVGIQGGYWC